MQALNRISQQASNILKFLQGPFRPSYEAALAPLAPEPQLQQWGNDSDSDPKSEGFLWGVPKRRRSIEVRWSRNMGAKNWVWKMLVPKTNLRICDTCGHHYEAKHLCRNCYEKIKTESELIREAIETKLGPTPEDKSVVVLYAQEKEKIDANATLNKLVVEVEKPRPTWFSSNLLQKTTAKPDPETTTVTVSKNHLG